VYFEWTAAGRGASCHVNDGHGAGTLDRHVSLAWCRLGAAGRALYKAGGGDLSRAGT